MKRAVIISQYLPPTKFIGTVRIAEVANQFSKNDYEVIGFSSNNYLYSPQDSFFLDERIKIKRSNSFDFLVLRMWLSKKLRGQKKENHTTRTTAKANKGESFKTVLFGFLANYLPFSLIFGEGSFVYIVRAFFKVLPYVKKDTIVFTSFRPYSDLLIGFLLKVFKPGSVWICDFRDPHIPPNKKNIFFRVHNFINKRICRRANVVTTVSNGVAENLKGYNRNIKVLRNGIVGSIKTEASRPDQKEFRIVYTGGLYNGTRNPSILFRTLSEMLQQGKLDYNLIKLVYAGNDKAIWDEMIQSFQLEKINCSYGLISLAESKALQESASINLLLTWCDRNNKGVLTGKMYEYFRAARPIITIINGDQDREIEEIMTETKAGPVVYNTDDCKSLSSFIFRCFQDFLEGKPLNSIDEESLQKYQWDFFFPQFLEELNFEKPKLTIHHHAV